MILSLWMGNGLTKASFSAILQRSQFLYGEPRNTLLQAPLRGLHGEEYRQLRRARFRMSLLLRHAASQQEGSQDLQAAQRKEGLHQEALVERTFPKTPNRNRPPTLERRFSIFCYFLRPIGFLGTLFL